MKTSADRFKTFLGAPVDVASLALFRVLFGSVLCVAALRFVAKGWVRSQLIAPQFHFTYPHLEFVRPVPETWMYALFGVLVAAAIALTVGFKSRLAAAVLAVGWGYIELIDRATYLNHYYLVCLMAMMLACTPAGAAVSLDAHAQPERAATTMPRWILLALRFQVAIVYAFAGFAKLNADWLVHAQPLRIWLAAVSGNIPWLDGWLTHASCAFVASWLGAAFDLSIVPLLSFPRTRCYAFAAAVAFHGLTRLLLPIGMFPWIMLACATLLLNADWPRRWLPVRSAPVCARSPLLPSVILGLHCAVQLLIPLHHHLLVRDSAWTNEGFDFAWKVMVAEKAGSVRYIARDRSSGRIWSIAPSTVLTPLQESALGKDPHLIVAFARYLGRQLRTQTGNDVAVYAEAFASLNGRPAQRLIAGDVDLTREPLPAHAVVPFDRLR